MDTISDWFLVVIQNICCSTHTQIQLKERFTKPKGVCTNAKIQDVNKNEDKSLLLLLLLLLQDLKQSEPKVNPKIHFRCCCPERERKRMCAPARERVENQDLRELREEQLSNNSSIKCYIFEWNWNGSMIKLLFCKVKFVVSEPCTVHKTHYFPYHIQNVFSSAVRYS